MISHDIVFECFISADLGGLSGEFSIKRICKMWGTGSDVISHSYLFSCRSSRVEPELSTLSDARPEVCKTR